MGGRDAQTREARVDPLRSGLMRRTALAVGLIVGLLALVLVVVIAATDAGAAAVGGSVLVGSAVVLGALLVYRELNAMADSLEESLQKARAAEAARDEFFGLVSHELRTPLTSIVGYVELLTEELEGGAELSDEERSRFLEIIKHNSRRLLRLVGDLLFVARLEAGRLDFETARFDLAKPVRDSVDAASPRAVRAGLDLECEAEEGLVLEGDEGRVGQAIDNLITNAIKFTPEGGSVTVRLRRHPEGAAVEVADKGVGIPADEQGRLFDRYYRASTGTGAEGIGLGLVITNAIVEGHGGRLELESAAGEGSTFRIVLPLAA